MFKHRKAKYHSNKVEVDGIVFDSKKEARRYSVLKTLLRKKKISNLKRQVAYELYPALYYEPLTKKFSFEKKKGFKSVHRGKYYYADFVYTNEYGEEVVEDVKGYRTSEYKRKKRLMKLIHGIEILET